MVPSPRGKDWHGCDRRSPLEERGLQEYGRAHMPSVFPFAGDPVFPSRQRTDKRNDLGVAQKRVAQKRCADSGRTEWRDASGSRPTNAHGAIGERSKGSVERHDYFDPGIPRSLDFLKPDLDFEKPNLDFFTFGNPSERPYRAFGDTDKTLSTLSLAERPKYRTLPDTSLFGIRSPLDRDSKLISQLMDEEPSDAAASAARKPFVNAFDSEGTDLPSIPVYYDQAAQMELPTWRDDDEKNEHRYYMWRFHCSPCTLFTQGHCPRHKPIMKCFNYHFETQRRRPLVDTVTWQLNYWDAPCPDAMHGPCPRGDYCFFAHNRDEISYHAAKYKTKLCNEKDCRGEHICCFAHGLYELRTEAATKYSYFNRLKEVVLPRQGEGLSALYHPDVYKHRFCASFPNISLCKRGEQCAFAHSRGEIRTPLLSEEEELHTPAKMTDHFFMYKFKTLWCPVGVQHDWQTCVYAHNYQDARRHPSIGYGPRPCPFWNRKQTDAGYAQRCPNGVKCPYAHGAKEQLYHPAYFRTVPCQEKMHCPRAMHCVFWHSKAQRRKPQAKDEDFDYEPALGEDSMKYLQVDFTAPLYQAFLGIGQNDYPSTSVALEDPHPSDPYAEAIEASIVKMERQMEKRQAEKSMTGEFGSQRVGESPQRPSDFPADLPRRVDFPTLIEDYPTLTDELLRKQAEQWEESNFIENGTNSLRADAPVFHPIFSPDDETPTAREKQSTGMVQSEEDLINEDWKVRQSLEFLWTEDSREDKDNEAKSPKSAPQRLYRCFSSPPIMTFHAIG